MRGPAQSSSRAAFTDAASRNCADFRPEKSLDKDAPAQAACPWGGCQRGIEMSASPKVIFAMALTGTPVPQPGIYQNPDEHRRAVNQNLCEGETFSACRQCRKAITGELAQAGNFSQGNAVTFPSPRGPVKFTPITPSRHDVGRQDQARALIA
jgi:hypothetical protein